MTGSIHRCFLRLTPRTISLQLIVLCLLLLSACSKTKEEGVVKLVFWHAWGGEEAKCLEELVDEFNSSHPHIKVKITYFLIGDKLMAAIAGGIPPDVATVWDWMLPTMGESGCFIPLNDYLEASGITPDDYLPHIWEYGMFSDQKYGVSTTLNVQMIYYNRELLREVEWDPDQYPESIEELSTLASRLLKFNKGKLERIGYIPENHAIWFWNFGGKIYDPSTHRFTINSPENLKALRWMTSFYQAYGIDQYRRFVSTYGEYDSPNNPFYQGKIAMREEGQWQIAFTKRYAPSLDYGVMPYPSAVEGRNGVTIAAGSFWTIPTGCRHPDEAWEFLNWLISPEQSSRIAVAFCNIPPMKEALFSESFKPVLSSRMKPFIDLLLEGRAITFPALPMGQTLNSSLRDTFENVSAGDLTPEEALRTLNEELQRELNKSLHYLGMDRTKHDLKR